jgi:glutaredoxin
MRKQERKLVIDFLYLDLSSCSRCQATDRVLDRALDDMRGELKDVKELTVNKVRITSDREAEQLKVTRSPTIRINGMDAEEILAGKAEVTDSCCPACAKVCGNSMPKTTGGGDKCRTFSYRGKTYSSPPKEMIKEAIRKLL